MISQNERIYIRYAICGPEGADKNSSQRIFTIMYFEMCIYKYKVATVNKKYFINFKALKHNRFIQFLFLHNFAVIFLEKKYYKNLYSDFKKKVAFFITI